MNENIRESIYIQSVINICGEKKIYIYEKYINFEWIKKIKQVFCCFTYIKLMPLYEMKKRKQKIQRE